MAGNNNTNTTPSSIKVPSPAMAPPQAPSEEVIALTIQLSRMEKNLKDTQKRFASSLDTTLHQKKSASQTMNAQAAHIAQLTRQTADQAAELAQFRTTARETLETVAENSTLKAEIKAANEKTRENARFYNRVGEKRDKELARLRAVNGEQAAEMARLRDSLAEREEELMVLRTGELAKLRQQLELAEERVRAVNLRSIQ